MIFNRPFVGYLNNEQVTIYSLDVVERIKTGTIESDYKFVFKMSKEIYQKIKNQNIFNFRVYPDFEVLLYLNFRNAGEIDGIIEATYEITKVENINV